MEVPTRPPIRIPAMSSNYWRILPYLG